MKPPPLPSDEYVRQHLERVVPLTEAEFAFVHAQFTRKRYRKHQALFGLLIAERG